MSNLIDRVLSRVAFDHDCWKWHGFHTKDGYAKTSVGHRRVRSVHRVLYEALVGPIPKGMEIDHLCRNRGCVNPQHLEPVTHKANMNRGLAGAHLRAKTHCPQGHAYAGDTLIVSEIVDRRGRRYGVRSCRICVREAQRRYRERFPKATPSVRMLSPCCTRGHEFTPENTYTWTSASGKSHRFCRECMRASDRVQKQRKRARKHSAKSNTNDRSA